MINFMPIDMNIVLDISLITFSFVDIVEACSAVKGSPPYSTHLLK